ncbi:B12-binding domain-containing radical SAM protein|uniref:Radical SAM superfamily enzyme YgiQ, UPF0313 family n=1 Tax=Dendrosporobacter quercicolus TaxID=146817 RepID=A0A1G9ZBI8_9FIRM|nr:B12-binding domain-containing radical SAM protein [Dendrosporobacter quercicolus]NSL49768.1 B12-binding domain-containing radical SAM protein [Dendrosporobacter quercicolus DSM 1736]SDN18762.1 Radical SAM superfamily enzyme YgiQ, UPF0313 family [Dendrosporobacter quercicolus]
MKIVLATLNAKYIHSSLALRYLRNFCRSVGDITIREFSINNGLLEILSQLYAEQPKVVGLACYIWNIGMTLELAGLLKKVLPDTVIILGGPEVSYDPAEIMTDYSAVDYIIQGEGEETLHRLLSSLKANSGIAGIANLTGRVNGRIASTGGPGIVAELDRIPFPYQDDDMTVLKDKIIYYESSRGCPFSCQYCLSSTTSGVRFLSLERVMQDLRFFIKHEVRQVKFVDRTFNARKDHYLPLLKFIASQDCRTNFHFEIAADLLDDEALTVLKAMPKGRVQLEIGVQSTHKPTLIKIKRSNNWPKIVEYVTRIISFGNIHVHLDLIVGLPEENYEQFGRSFNDVYRLKPQMLQLGFLKMLKGSGIRCSAGEHRYIFMESAPYQVLGNKYLAYHEIRKLQLLESVFEQIYNTNRFSNSLDCFIEFHGGNAFAFYTALTEFWEENQLHLVAHSAKALYLHLFEFCQKHYQAAVLLCAELLKFDALVNDRGSIRPEVLNWNENRWNEETTRFWRNTELVRKYIPDYQFGTWRELKKKYHIEVFSIDIPAYLAGDKSLAIANQPVLFLLAGDSVGCKTIDRHDFWQGGQ